MSLSQDFRFRYETRSQLQEFLRTQFDNVANLDDRRELLVFTSKADPKFTFDCVIMPFGLRTDRAGDYFTFLGRFIEALTGEFGTIEVEDVWSH